VFLPGAVETLRVEKRLLAGLKIRRSKTGIKNSGMGYLKYMHLVHIFGCCGAWLATDFTHEKNLYDLERIIKVINPDHT
jgi:hypothetical protein